MKQALPTVGAVLWVVASVACGNPGSRVIDGVTVTVSKGERVKAINEEHAKINTDAAQEFMKVVLTTSGLSESERAAAVKGWDVTLVDEAGKPQGPMFGWRFGDKDGNEWRVYSNPIPVGTRFSVIKIQGQQLSLKGF